MKKVKGMVIVATLCLMFTGCYRSSKEELVHLQIVDRNGYIKTIVDSSDMKKYEKVDVKAPSHHQKVIRVYDKNNKGMITLYHDNGLLWQYLETKSNRAHGVFEEYYPSGRLKIKATVLEGIADLTDIAKTSWVFDGKSLVYDEDGNKVASIPYKQGNEDGEALYYYVDGSIQKKVPYKKGKIDGMERGYNNEGKLVLVSNYVEGKKDGESFFKGDIGKAAYEEVYIKGRLVHGIYKDLEGKTFSLVENSCGKRPSFKDGKLAQVEEIKEGKVEGEVINYLPNGTIASSYFLVDGLKDGEETVFYPYKEGMVPIKKLMVTWRGGLIHGRVCTWYPNGTLESEKEMSDHKKEGMYLSWYEDSSLMMVEEYSKDRLVNGKYLQKGDSTPISRVIDGMGIAYIYDKNGSVLQKVSYYNGSPVE